jgi:hypothetical protein
LRIVPENVGLGVKQVAGDGGFATLETVAHRRSGIGDIGVNVPGVGAFDDHALHFSLIGFMASVYPMAGR